MKKELNIIGRRKLWYAISLIVIIIGMASLGFQGMNLGLDFSGGNLIQVDFAEAPDPSELRATVESYVSQTPTIQQSGATDFLIRTVDMPEEDSNAMLAELQTKFGDMEVLRNERIGPTMGNELITKAVLALVIALVLMLIYISIRFQFYFAISAIVPLLHDVLITIGLFSLLQVEINSAFIAAILTILGYSINNTIVVFDRVRENMHKENNYDVAELVNTSINQTLARSINTTVAVLILLFALFFLGGSSTKDFALALLIGLIAGCYSSVCIAGSILTDLVRKSKKRLTAGKVFLGKQK